MTILVIVMNKSDYIKYITQIKVFAHDLDEQDYDVQFWRLSAIEIAALRSRRWIFDNYEKIQPTFENEK